MDRKRYSEFKDRACAAMRGNRDESEIVKLFSELYPDASIEERFKILKHFIDAWGHELDLVPAYLMLEVVLLPLERQFNTTANHSELLLRIFKIYHAVGFDLIGAEESDEGKYWDRITNRFRNLPVGDAEDIRCQIDELCAETKKGKWLLKELTACVDLGPVVVPFAPA